MTDLETFLALAGEDENTPETTVDVHYGATISTGHYLASRYAIDELDESFEDYASESEASYFEDERDFMESQGYERVSRDNTYNCENDLSVCFVWAVWLPKGCGDDWTCATDDAIVSVAVSHGGDPRGSYSRPRLCTAEGDYTCPADLSADWYVSEARDCDGDDIFPDVIADEWGSGYSSYPFGKVTGDVARWFECLSTKESLIALLHSGERVKIHAAIPYGGE